MEKKPRRIKRLRTLTKVVRCATDTESGLTKVGKGEEERVGVLAALGKEAEREGRWKEKYSRAVAARA